MLRFACTLAAAVALATGASAQPMKPAVAADIAVSPPADSPVGEPAPEAAQLSEDELAGVTGGDTGVAAATTNIRTDQNLNAVNRGNTITANSVVNGDVTLDANAFDGFNGIGNFVVNTGNNNNLQGALSVTVIAP